MIEIKDGVMSAGGCELFRELSFQVDKGEIVGVVGPRSCGKSSLLRAFLGLVPLDEGFVCIDGEPILPSTLPFFRSSMCYLPQDLPSVGCTVAEFLSMLLELRSNRATVVTKEKLFEEWATLDIDKSLYDCCCTDVSPSSMRLIILSVFVLLRKPYVILDEPVVEGDDSAYVAMVVSLLRRLSAGSSVLLSTHEEAVLSLCDKVIKIGANQ